MEATAPSIYTIPVTTIDGAAATLEPYRGQVLLVVNVASKCGFTPQYAGLEELYRTYKDRGLVVLGFPCNQFMWQEPGGADEIKSFCTLKYNVSFPMFAKVDVNGSAAHPLYEHLKGAARGTLGTRGIKWNFTKFLVDRAGTVVRRYGTTTEPKRIAGDIEKLLANNEPGA
jgi:glutathione peroxidase